MLVLGLALGSSMAAAGWIVTRDGGRIETRGAWRVEGEQAVFTTVRGEVQSIALSELNLDASSPPLDADLVPQKTPAGEESGSSSSPEAAPPPNLPESAPPPSGRSPASREDWEDDEEAGLLSEGSFETRLRLRGRSFDNYFRVPDGEPQEDVTSSQADARFSWRIARDKPYRLYAQVTRSTYDDPEVDTSLSYRTGFRLDADKHRLDLYAEYEEDRRELDIGDEFLPGDIRSYRLTYDVRPSESWQLRGLAGFRDQSFEASEEESELRQLGASVRYRGWSRMIAPELGVQWREREALGEDNDYDEPQYELRLLSYPTDRLRLRLKFAIRARDYGKAAPDSRNFGREDDREIWQLLANYELTRRLVLDFVYEAQENDSSRPERDYSTAKLEFGLTVKIESE